MTREDLIQAREVFFSGFSPDEEALLKQAIALDWLASQAGVSAGSLADPDRVHAAVLDKHQEIIVGYARRTPVRWETLLEITADMTSPIVTLDQIANGYENVANPQKSAASFISAELRPFLEEKGLTIVPLYIAAYAIVDTSQ